MDFCQRCWPGLATALKRYNALGDGPDDRGNCFDYDASHPDYDGEDYVCYKCGRRLTEKDDFVNS
jgi:hypothetical protein